MKKNLMKGMQQTIRMKTDGAESKRMRRMKYVGWEE